MPPAIRSSGERWLRAAAILALALLASAAAYAIAIGALNFSRIAV